MYSFVNDYSEGCHSSIMEALQKTNMLQTAGYGEDEYCAQAKEKIRRALKSDCEVEFLVSGTQTNFTVISHILKPYEGILGVDTCHPEQHEAGAIEATGHKVITVPNVNGKLTAEAVEKTLREHLESPIMIHTVRPGLVYISNATELGTVYTKKELTELHEICRKYNIPLYIDGARLGCAMASKECDYEFSELSDLCDVFYIGATKMGALFGEAVVFNDKKLAENFPYMKKQRGGLLAKGRLLGIQFSCLFEDNLYFKLADYAVKQAQRIQDALIENKIPLLVKSSTNQVFPILTYSQQQIIAKDFGFELWEPIDDEKSSVRFCTSWATDEKQVDRLIEALKLI